MRFLPAPNTPERWSMPNQRIDQIGWYETRRGELVYVNNITANWVGAIRFGGRKMETWLRHGAKQWGPMSPDDLIIYYGPDLGRIQRTYL
jgi:hypothetical protein